jgi:hypothetical protein
MAPRPVPEASTCSSVCTSGSKVAKHESLFTAAHKDLKEAVSAEEYLN